MAETLYENGDAVEGEKLIITARKFKDKGLCKRPTSSHNLQQYNAEGTAKAVISKPMRAIRDTQ